MRVENIFNPQICQLFWKNLTNLRVGNIGNPQICQLFQPTHISFFFTIQVIKLKKITNKQICGLKIFPTRKFISFFQPTHSSFFLLLSLEYHSIDSLRTIFPKLAQNNLWFFVLPSTTRCWYVVPCKKKSKKLKNKKLNWHWSFSKQVENPKKTQKNTFFRMVDFWHFFAMTKCLQNCICLFVFASFPKVYLRSNTQMQNQFKCTSVGLESVSMMMMTILVVGRNATVWVYPLPAARWAAANRAFLHQKS